MRFALALLGCLALSRVAHGADDPASDRVSMSVGIEKSTYYVGEPFTIRLWIRYDEAFFKDHAVASFLQPMDLPIRIEAPWIGEWKGASRIDVGRDGHSGLDPVRVVLNGAVTALEPGLRSGGPGTDGPIVSSFHADRTYVAVDAGELVVEAPTLSFAYATEFKDDLIHGRSPADRREVVVRGERRTLHVLALPTTGRPPEFQGAIGSFSVIQVVDRSAAVTVGEHFHLTLRIYGEGNLVLVPTPRLDDLAGFHVYGAIDDKRPRSRTIVYDVAAVRADVKEIPPIRFAYFDPGPPAGYRVVSTDPIPLDVRAPAGAPRTEVPDSDQSGDSSSGSLIGTLVVLLAILVLAIKRPARAGAIGDPATSRAAAAALQFRERVARPTADVAAAFADVLAAHLNCPAAAVIAPDLEARLLAQRWSPALAARAAAMMDRLVHAGYGASGAPTDVDDARALVKELDEKVRSAQSPR